MSRNYLILGASSDVGIQLIKEINDREKNAVIWAHYCSSDEHLKEIKQINGNEIVPVGVEMLRPEFFRRIGHLYFTPKRDMIILRKFERYGKDKYIYDKQDIYSSIY